MPFPNASAAWEPAAALAPMLMPQASRLADGASLNAGTTEPTTSSALGRDS
jgi:hypothetical protein